MKLIDIIHPERIRVDLTSGGKMDVLSELGALLASGNSTVSVEAVTHTLVDRERLATTGVGGGVAIPHGKLEGLKTILAAVGISKTGIPFDAVDNAPVTIFVALVAPLNSSGDHLRALARISRLLKHSTVRRRLIEARSSQEVYEIIKQEDGER